mgnify:CR=1 FL=1
MDKVKYSADSVRNAHGISSEKVEETSVANGLNDLNGNQGETPQQVGIVQGQGDGNPDFVDDNDIPF